MPLNVIPVRIPSLKSRREDIPLLFNHFVFEYCTQYNRDLINISDSTLSQLIVRDWEGNVRELRNIAERFVITGFLPDDEVEFHEVISADPENTFSAPEGLSLPEMVGAYEKHLIEEEFKRNNGVVEETYKGLHIPRKTLYDKIKKYNINRKLFKSNS